MATHESHEKKLMEAFLVAAGGDEEGMLCKPGVEGLNSFFATCLPKEFLGAVRIRKVYADLDHDEDADLSLKELEDFAVRLKEPAAGQDEADIEVEAKPALDISALVDKIEIRRAANERPLLDASDMLSEDARTLAEATLPLVDKVEYVELQSYVERMVGETLASMPADPNTPNKVREAITQRENYYFWMRAYLVEKSFKSGIMAHKMIDNLFVALLPPQSLGDQQERAEAVDAVQKMTQELLPKFDNALWAAWKKKEQAFAYLDVDVDVSNEFKQFVAKDYYLTMKDIIATSRTSSAGYTPPVPVEQDASAAEVLRRKDALQHIDLNTGKEVEERVEQKWDAFVSTCDAAIQALCKKGQPTKKFLCKEFYPTLFEFNAEASMRHGDGFLSPSKSLAAAGHDKCPGASSAYDTAGAGHGGSQPAMRSGMDALLNSPAKQTRMAESPLVEFRSAFSIMQAPPRTKCKFQGILLRCDEELRSFKTKLTNSPQKRKANEDEENVAMNLMLGDQTGPVSVTLWGDAARCFLRALGVHQAGSGASPSAAVMVMLDIAEVIPPPQNAWNGQCLTSMRSLHSIAAAKERAGTNVSVGNEATSPFLLSSVFVEPPPEVCVSVFSAIKSKLIAPFRGTFKGVVMELRSIDYTKNGNEVRYFVLVDSVGSYIPCAAMDHNAKSDALAEGNEVLLYFMTGRGPIGSSKGMLYAMKDASIVPLGHTFLAGLPTHEIEIKEKQ
jgi:hypothetical protein